MMGRFFIEELPQLDAPMVSSTVPLLLPLPLGEGFPLLSLVGEDWCEGFPALIHARGFTKTS